MKGFTLVEILVVIGIMGILGTLGFINYKTFQATQVLNEGVSLVQSTLRAAQSNATAALKCQNLGGAIWQVSFENNRNFNLKCKVGTFAASIQRSYNLPTDIQILSISSNSCEALYPFSVSFSPLYGAVSFESSASCIVNQSSTMIRLTNIKTNEVKSVSIAKGGAIDAQK